MHPSYLTAMFIEPIVHRYAEAPEVGVAVLEEDEIEPDRFMFWSGLENVQRETDEADGLPVEYRQIDPARARAWLLARRFKAEPTEMAGYYEWTCPDGKDRRVVPVGEGNAPELLRWAVLHLAAKKSWADPANPTALDLADL